MSCYPMLCIILTTLSLFDEISSLVLFALESVSSKKKKEQY